MDRTTAGKTIRNRSVPMSTVIPVLSYEDVRQASAWLCEVFGFRERLQIGAHRAQLLVGAGAVILTEGGDSGTNGSGHSILVQVEDIDNHYERARSKGAHILQAPTDFPYGERQYNVQDIGGHTWTFSQSIADIDPASWGGILHSTNQ